MRKPQPIELEISITDTQYFQDKINSIFLDIVKYTLDNSPTTYKEKTMYIDNIIQKLKSG